MTGRSIHHSLSKSALGLLSAALVMFFSTPAEAKVNFEKEVWPILAENCVKCHQKEYKDPKTGRTKRPKGGLRLDNAALMIKGIEDDGEWFEVIVPGKPEKSTFYTTTTLDPDDDDIMPAKGDPLTKAQQEILKKWVAEGAEFGGWTEGVASEGDGHKQAAAQSKVDMLAKDVKPAPDKVLDPIRKLGALAMPLAQNNNLVRVDYSLVGDKIGDANLAQLQALDGHLTALNLANTKVTDAGVQKLTKYPKLTRLHLEKTAVGDAALAAVAKLENLEYLNLYKTNVTDAGLKHLEGMKNLKQVYLWQSKVTKPGVEKLRKAKPDAIINNGWEAPPKAAATGDKKGADYNALAKLFDAGSCCGKAHKDGGKKCGHKCCKDATAKGEVCLKCNPGAKKKQAAAKEGGGKVTYAVLAKYFDDGSCCGKAHKNGGKKCGHGCCKKAAAKGEVCLKCNPGAKGKKIQ